MDCYDYMIQASKQSQFNVSIDFDICEELFLKTILI